MTQTALESNRDVNERYYRAMEAGSSDQMDGLFEDDAICTEPFSTMGAPTTHAGRTDIVGWLAASFEAGNKDVTITLDRLDVDGSVVVAEWRASVRCCPDR